MLVSVVAPRRRGFELRFMFKHEIYCTNPFNLQFTHNKRFMTFSYLFAEKDCVCVCECTKGFFLKEKTLFIREKMKFQQIRLF